MTKKSSSSLGRVTAIVLAFILVFVALQRILSPVISPSSVPKDGEKCMGKPIIVDYPYQGDMLDPHECNVQCEDDDNNWRYIVYTNEKATQCEKPPLCSDWGEDNGVTCKPPEEGE
ncbi:MAG: hypothetical protein KAS32_03890 [Candidatus Peribacteraceae bacterium]|nr:hypothetical protein [Candidatus Peribacteraceae bacterium]